MSTILLQAMMLQVLEMILKLKELTKERLRFMQLILMMMLILIPMPMCSPYLRHSKADEADKAITSKTCPPPRTYQVAS